MTDITSSLTSFLVPSQSTAGMSQVMCKGTSFNSLENCDDTPLCRDWSGGGGGGSSWSPQNTRYGVFSPACPEEGGPWGCPTKLVEDSSSEPGHLNLWARGHLSGATEALGLGACHRNQHKDRIGLDPAGNPPVLEATISSQHSLAQGPW